MLKLPNFFLAGVPKAGTTSLWHYLAQHPQIYMSPLKEPNFFSAEIREENFASELRRSVARQNRGLRQFLSGPMRKRRLGGIVADWKDYLRLYANAAEEPAVGEASVCYFWSPAAPARIAERIPDARILVMLRNPIDRAFSQYLHGLANGAIRWSLREHIQRNLRHTSGQFCVHYPFLEFGLYAEQFSRYRERFGRNIWIGFYEDFKKHSIDVIQNIFRFLGVEPDFVPNTSRQHLEAQVPRVAGIGWLKRSGIWRLTSRATPASLRPFIRRRLIRAPGTTCIDPADRHYLLDFYRDDIRRLASLLGRDLDAWLH